MRPMFPLLMLLLAACSAAAKAALPKPTASPQTPESTALPLGPTATSAQAKALPAGEEGCGDPFAGSRPRFSVSYWPDTDFCQHSVSYDEIFSGGPPPDGIPALDDPQFESLEAADDWLDDNQPVIAFEHVGEARAYPLAVLIWHEIANDTVGGLPVAVTFCPLCNATVVFDRRLPDGRVLDFGTSGNLRYSDLIMYDRQTKSWWQQFTGEAIVGELTGEKLTFLPAQIVSWAVFKQQYPEGQSLSRDTGYGRAYGRNPYVGYDTISSTPFLFEGVVDGRLPAMARVVAVALPGDGGLTEYVAYPFDLLQQEKVVNDSRQGLDLVVFWKEGTASALGADTIAEADSVGSTGVFSRDLDGQTLTFEAEGELFRDQETGSLWNLFGQAVSGPLQGQQLEKLVSHEYFWFSWAAFRPDTAIYAGS